MKKIGYTIGGLIRGGQIIPHGTKLELDAAEAERLAAQGQFADKPPQETAADNTQQIADMSADIEKVTKELKACQTELDEITANIESGKAELGQIKGQVKASKAELEQITSKIKSGKTELSKLEAEIADAEKKSKKDAANKTPAAT